MKTTNHKTNDSSPKLERINEAIRYPRVRVIKDGVNIGIMSSFEAKKIAYDENLDLVEIDSHTNPPVCRVIDYSKFKYEKSIKEKELKKQQRVKSNITKTVTLKFGIEQHDLEIKANNVCSLLKEGYKVLIQLQHRGRENRHREVGESKVTKLLDILSTQLPISVDDYKWTADKVTLNCLISKKS